MKRYGARSRHATFVAMALALGGCTGINELVNPPKPVIVQLDVWNRNRRQVLTAHRFVAWHPAANLEAFVVGALPPAR